MTVVDVLVLRNAMPSSVAITFDAFAAANRLRTASGRAPAFELRISGSGATHYHSLVPGKCLTRRRASDIVVVPGLGLITEDEIRARLSERDISYAGRRLVEAAERGTELATSCSGTFLFARAGLLNGRRATTSWWLAPLFRQMYPSVHLDTDALIVTDGSIITAGAALAQMDLVLSIISRWSDASLADGCARYLLLDQRRSQARYMALDYLSAADSIVAKAQAWAHAHLAQEFGVRELAAATNLTTRTFARRVERATGLTPVRFLQRIRVERAVELLETTRISLEEIAVRVGYADPSTLRRLIQRFKGHRPRDLRGHQARGRRSL